MPRKPSPSSPSPGVHPVNVRLDVRARDALQRAQRATGGAFSAHRVARDALTLGARMIEADPSLMFKLAAETAEGAPTPSPVSAVASSSPADAPRRGEALAVVAAPARGPGSVGAADARRRPRGAPRAPGGAEPGAPVESGGAAEKGSRAKASPVEIEAASTAIRRARAAGHGARAILAAAELPNTGGAREAVQHLAADPRPVRTFTRALVRRLTAGALVLSPAPLDAS